MLGTPRFEFSFRRYQDPKDDSMTSVFMSWSKERSKHIAQALDAWLPCVFTDVTTWISQHDIAAGSRWGQSLGEALQQCKFGVICLTPDNIDSSWLMFEAGALSKSFVGDRVVPLLYQLTRADVKSPLLQFQSVEADANGILALLRSINQIRDHPIDQDHLKRIFEMWWPDLEKRLSLGTPPEVSLRARSDRELLEELLELVRQGATTRPETQIGMQDKSVYRIRKRVYDLLATDIEALVTEDLLVTKEQITYRLNRVGNLEEEAHLSALLESVDLQLRSRVAGTRESEIASLSNPELLHYIEVGEARLKNGPLSYREDDLIEARLDVVRKELERRAKRSEKTE